MPVPRSTIPNTGKKHETIRDIYASQEGTARGVFLREYPGAFSASDVYAIVKFPGGVVRYLGHLAALSVSTHRDTFPVAKLGRVTPVGFTQGHRTVGGTLVFHTLDRSALNYRYRPLHQHADELPLFDILLTYVNEVGMASVEEIVGVRVLDFGKAVSLENLHPTETYSFMALDYKPMRSLVGDPVSRLRVLKRRMSREKVALRLGDATIASIYDPVEQEYADQYLPDDWSDTPEV